MMPLVSSLLSSFLDFCSSILYYTVRTTLLFTLFLSFCHSIGWLHRFLWFCLEWYLSFLANGTKVTVGSFEYNLWKGQVLGYNVVVHTPQREEWQWESPLFCRVGRVYVEFSLVALLRDFCYSWEPPVDIYTVELMDAQVFVERHQHVFNFYLLDPMIILPDPKTILPPSDDEHEPDTPTRRTAANHEQEHDTTTNDHHNDSDDDAQQLVDDMLNSIQLASKKGNWKEALHQQRLLFTSKLKDIQNSDKKFSKLQHSLQNLRKMGQAVVEKTQDINTLPLRREDEMPPPNIRVGRILLRDILIFTRQHNTIEDEDDESWKKPITIQELSVKASELCPPMSLTDSDTGLPAVFQPIDKVWEVVWKRLLAESAKSQGGRLFNTAVAQVLGFIKVVPTKQASM